MSKTVLALSGLVVAVGSLGLFAGGALAETGPTITFEPSTYSLGDINGQDGWLKTGPYDVAVTVNTYNIAQFGSQVLRISDAVTSGSFGDQTFSKPLVNEAGEADALNGGLSSGPRQSHFEAQFDLASALPTLQNGMHVSVSPDRGDGARMSYLRFEDQTDGIHVFFDDVQGTSNPAHFVETDIATISRTAHTIKLAMDFVEGPSNDVVQVTIDSNIVHTGTSWENYYRFDPESNPTLVSNSRTVDSLLFRESGTANPSNAGSGFLIDNLSLMSGATLPVGPATNKDQCKNGGWMAFNSPTYKNQGDCVSAVASQGRAKGNPILNFFQGLFR